jgi:hypothetical protein
MNAARRSILSVFAVVLGALVLLGVPAPALAAEAPKVEEESVADVASTSATFDAQVNPEGAETTYAFEYASAGGSFKPVAEAEGSGSLPAGTTGVTLSVHLQGLSPGIAYEFRVVAGNAVERVSGEAVSFTTQHGGGGFVLPDGRQYEMVTPPEKEGALFQRLVEFDVTEFNNYMIQASAAGDAIADLASQPSEAEPQGDAEPSVAVLSTRGADGWSSQVIAPPHETVSVPHRNQPELALFSEDLSHVLVQQVGPFAPLSPEASEATPYVRTDYSGGNVNAHCDSPALSASSCFRPLVTRADDTASPFQSFGGGFRGGEEEEELLGVCRSFLCGPVLLDATPDLSHVILASNKLLDIPLTSPSSEDDLYEWSADEPPSEQLQPIAVLPASEGGGVVVSAGGTSSSLHDNPGVDSLSDDGSYFFSYGGHLYVHDPAKDESFRLDVAQNVSEPASGAAEFLYASSDGSTVLFSDPERLTSAPGGGIYDCQVAEVAGALACGGLELTDLESTGVSAGDLIGGSRDAAYLYFAGAGGEIYVDHYDGREWTRTKGLTVNTAQFIDKSGQAKDFRISPNGEWFAFMSNEDLTGYDNRDAVNGRPDLEVYEYNGRTETLACASCVPTGARPVGVENYKAGWVAANVPAPLEPFTAALREPHYQPRYLSDSGRLFFESVDALVPQDVDGVEDVYEYEPEDVGTCSSGSSSGSSIYKPAHAFEANGAGGDEGAGCVALVSSGDSGEPSYFLDASETGGDVFFLTASKLAPQDSDDAYDVYDAHECTSESPCIPPPASTPPACTTEASCRPSPTPQPSIYGLPSSATFSGSGNLASPPPPAPATVTKKKAPKCKKGTYPKKGKCVRKKSKKTKAKKSNRGQSR